MYLSNISGTFCTAYFLHADSILVEMCVVISWNYLGFFCWTFLVWLLSVTSFSEIINPTHLKLVFMDWSAFGFPDILFIPLLILFPRLYLFSTVCFFQLFVLSTMLPICTYGPVFTHFTIFFSMLLTTLFHLDLEKFICALCFLDYLARGSEHAGLIFTLLIHSLTPIKKRLLNLPHPVFCKIGR